MRTVLLILCCVGLFVSSKLNTTSLNVGDKAIDFTLKNVDGKMVSLSDFKDAKGYIVVFTCNTCPYAQAYEDRIIALDKKYAPQGYPVVAINPNDVEAKPGDSFEKMKERAKEKDFPYPYLIDTEQKVTRTYGASRTPHVFLLGKDLVVRYIGAIDNNYQNASAATEKYVEDAIEALKSGKEVETNFTKAIGCTIKWKES